MDDIENVSFEDAPTDKYPLCPYCKQPLQTIWTKTSGLGFRGQETILMCPSCESFLGFNAWKRD